MAKKLANGVVVSIDIGTTKICVIVARASHEHDIEILGVGRAPSDGLRKGVVVDIGKTVESIKRAVKEAEFISGHTIETAVVGISGSHIKSFNSHGAVPIKNNEVRKTDMSAALTAARAVSIPEGQQILHVLPQYFTIDNQDRVVNPLGMFGVRLSVEAHVITGSIASVQNIIQCCQMAGVQVSDIVLEQLASAHAVLTQDERELGVSVLDIGGGTSDFALYSHGTIRYTMVLPVAGNHFTNDIAIGLQTTLREAERIKQNYGLACCKELLEEDIAVHTIQGDQTKMIKQSYLAKIIEPRAHELLSIVHKEVERLELSHYMTTGLVLTGGGALLNGMVDLAQDIFNVPVRIGKPQVPHVMPESLNSPIYSTGYGLLLHAIYNQSHGMGELDGPLVARIFFRMKSWISDFF